MSSSSAKNTEVDPLKDDLLKGAERIADHMGEDLRRVYYMCEIKAIPAFKLAGRWYCRKSKIRARIAELEARAAGKA